MSKATNEVLERWNFSIETDKEVVEKGYDVLKSLVAFVVSIEIYLLYSCQLLMFVNL